MRKEKEKKNNYDREEERTKVIEQKRKYNDERGKRK